jgi:F0F1-type ATP synthase assembly protein I
MVSAGSDPVPPEESEGSLQPSSLIARLTLMSSALTGPTLLGLVVDLALDTLPWGTVVGALVGMAAMFAQLVKFARSARTRGGRERDVGPK